MEQEKFDPELQEVYRAYIKEEEEAARKIFEEIAPELRIPVRRIQRWWIPAAAAVLLLVLSGTWSLTSEKSPFRPKPKYTQAEIRASLEKTIRALSMCSKTVREEFSQVENLTAMSSAIKPIKKIPSAGNRKPDSNTSKN